MGICVPISIACWLVVTLTFFTFPNDFGMVDRISFRGLEATNQYGNLHGIAFRSEETCDQLWPWTTTMGPWLCFRAMAEVQCWLLRIGHINLKGKNCHDLLLANPFTILLITIGIYWSVVDWNNEQSLLITANCCERHYRPRLTIIIADHQPSLLNIASNDKPSSLTTINNCSPSLWAVISYY